MFWFNSCQADEYGREHGEDHCLDEAYQALEAHHEDAHHHRQHRHRQLYSHRLGCHQEDDAGNGDGNGVTGHHVGEKSDHQGERLREDADELNHGNNGDGRLQPCGHIGPEDVLPVVLVARELHDEERAEGQEERHGEPGGNGIKPITLQVKMKKKQVSR